MKLLHPLLALLPLAFAAFLPETSPAVNNVFGDENDFEVCLVAVKEMHACSIPCMVSSAQPVDCWPLDMKCMCGKKEKFFKEAKKCFHEKCGLTKSIGVMAATRKVCQACV
ncbi:hypothetical protein QBC41DRAFT_41967 [Cercophora samala]|uniref:CFEM domain-containing protein n=1 Tax=Cercophora samala TaxID=330535 RepID=A0AA39YYS9_9PEZI|nr:hypothetical protein QBC41DRAFT_41967 [Cercophora samala]